VRKIQNSLHTENQRQTGRDQKQQHTVGNPSQRLTRQNSGFEHPSKVLREKLHHDDKLVGAVGIEPVCQSRRQVAITICPDKRKYAHQIRVYPGAPLRCKLDFHQKSGQLRLTSTEISQQNQARINQGEILCTA
jgi:hypothetical protein